MVISRADAVLGNECRETRKLFYSWNFLNTFCIRHNGVNMTDVVNSLGYLFKTNPL